MRIRMRAARSSASWCAECASTEKSCCRTILKMSLMLESNKLAKKIRRLFRISLYGTLNALSTRARALVCHAEARGSVLQIFKLSAAETFGGRVASF